MYHNYNNTLSCSTFATGMKYVDVTSIHKKDDKTEKTNYRPSILPNLSKVYERLMYNQIFPYFDLVFSKFQCGFWKGFNAQHCLVTMIQKWRKILDKGGETGAVLTDLSKTFDCIDHNLLMAKLNAYGFEKSRYSFFILTSLSVKKEPKSILGPLLFNIYICDIFFETQENIDFAGYADDNTPYTCSSKIQHVLTNLQGSSEKPFYWFSANHLVANSGKCHLLTSSNLPVDIRINSTKISNFEGRLNFDYHVNTLLRKANKKCHAHARVCNCMNTKKRVLMNAFMTSKFSYCPLVWMFHSSTPNNRINKIHEKAFKACLQK